VNGVISVPIMVVMMLLAVKPAVMGRFVVGRKLQVLGWLATLVMALTPLGWEVHKAGWLVLALLAGWADALGSPRSGPRMPGPVAVPQNLRRTLRHRPNHQQPVDENVAR